MLFIRLNALIPLSCLNNVKLYHSGLFTWHTFSRGTSVKQLRHVWHVWQAVGENVLWLKILVSSVTKPPSCKFGVGTWKLIEDSFCVSVRYMKSHCACLIKMTLISTEHFPKRFYLLWMDMSCKRSSQQKKRRGPLPRVPATQMSKSRVWRTELFKCTVKNFSDRDTDTKPILDEKWHHRKELGS